MTLFVFLSQGSPLKLNESVIKAAAFNNNPLRLKHYHFELSTSYCPERHST